MRPRFIVFSSIAPAAGEDEGGRLKKIIWFITRMGDAKAKSLKQNLSLSW